MHPLFWIRLVPVAVVEDVALIGSITDKLANAVIHMTIPSYPNAMLALTDLSEKITDIPVFRANASGPRLNFEKHMPELVIILETQLAPLLETPQLDYLEPTLMENLEPMPKHKLNNPDQPLPRTLPLEQALLLVLVLLLPAPAVDQMLNLEQEELGLILEQDPKIQTIGQTMTSLGVFVS